MNFNREQINDIRAALTFYMRHHISINSPRFHDYEVILQLLSKYKTNDGNN